MAGMFDCTNTISCPLNAGSLLDADKGRGLQKATLLQLHVCGWV